jgi:hypothetical protein
MLVRNLIPLGVLVAIVVHCGGTIKEKVAAHAGIGDKMLTKSRIVAILDAAVLEAAGSEDFTFASQEEFRGFVRQRVRMGKGKGDPAKDQWGTPLRCEIRGKIFKVFSAGPDRTFGTADDLAGEQELTSF